MKTKVLMPVLLSLMMVLFMNLPAAAATVSDDANDTLTLYSTEGLMPLAGVWMETYNSVQPDFAVQLKAYSEGVFKGPHGQPPGYAILSSEDLASPAVKNAWKMAVGRDVVVPVLNAANPFFAIVNQQGLSPGQLAVIVENSQQADWGTLFGQHLRAPVHFYYVKSPAIQSMVADFLKVEESNLEGTGVASEEELIKAIEADPYGLGFCRVVYVPEPGSKVAGSGVALLPIDRNGNGKLDYHEKIYGSLHDFMRGVWIGKYPRELVHSIYIISPAEPREGAPLSFAKWAITDGQAFVGAADYSELVNGEKQSKLESLSTDPVYTKGANDQYATVKILLLVMLGVVVLVLLLNVTIMKYRRTGRRSPRTPAHPGVIRENTLEMPGGVYFDKTHTWAYMDKCGYVMVGVDDFLQHVTGPFSGLHLKNPGEKIKKGEPFFTLVQNGKQLVVHAPVSGTIKAVNEDLEEEPYLVNESPYDEGWVYLIEPSNWQREIQFLRMAQAYRDWLRNEFTRLKDFLAARVNQNTFSYADTVLQEGGEVTDHVMEKLGPDIWEEFQKNFLDTPN